MVDSSLKICATGASYGEMPLERLLFEWFSIDIDLLVLHNVIVLFLETSHGEGRRRS